MSQNISKSNSKPNPFEYFDYRTFLRDHFEYRKSVNKLHSLRYFSNKAKLSAGFLPLILSGKREMSTKSLSKLAPHLGLKSSEISYLKLLLELELAESHDEKAKIVERMQKFRGYQKLNPDEVSAYQYLSHWYYVTIKEMTAISDFSLDPEKIKKRLINSVPLKEIEDAISFLRKQKFISDTPTPTATNKNVDCTDGVFQLSLANFHKEMMEIAIQSITNTSHEKRTILGYTLAVNQKQRQKISRLLEQLQEEIRKVENEPADGKDDIYHVVLASFPLTKDFASED